MNHARPAEGCVNASRPPLQRVGLRQEGLIYVRQSDVLGRIRQPYGKGLGGWTRGPALAALRDSWVVSSKRPANARSGGERTMTGPHRNVKRLEPNGAAGNSTRR